VPKTGQLIQKLSIYQSVTKKHVVLGYIGKMDIGVLQVPSHQANERGFRRPKSKNRSTVKVRFRHPSLAYTINGPTDIFLADRLTNVVIDYHHSVANQVTAGITFEQKRVNIN
jgi:hypothetical protein